MCERHYHDHRRNLVDNISAGGAKTPQQIEREKKKEREERAKEVSDSDNEEQIGAGIRWEFGSLSLRSLGTLF